MNLTTDQLLQAIADKLVYDQHGAEAYDAVHHFINLLAQELPDLLASMGEPELAEQVQIWADAEC